VRLVLRANHDPHLRRLGEKSIVVEQALLSSVSAPTCI
jgi:hypothetical protein